MHIINITTNKYLKIIVLYIVVVVVVWILGITGNGVVGIRERYAHRGVNNLWIDVDKKL